jgi:hypothetical protein
MMLFKFQTFGNCLASLLLAISSRTSVANKERIIARSQSIAAGIQNAHASGDLHPRFRLQAERFGSETDYEVHVRVATPAVTSKTTMSVNGGESKYVDEDDVATMLVSDEPDSALVLIAVEKKGGKVDGIIQKDGEKIKFTQKGGGGKVRFMLESRCAYHNILFCPPLLNVNLDFINRYWRPSPKTLYLLHGRAATIQISNAGPSLSPVTVTTTVTQIMTTQLTITLITLMTSTHRTL